MNPIALSFLEIKRDNFYYTNRLFKVQIVLEVIHILVRKLNQLKKSFKV